MAIQGTLEVHCPKGCAAQEAQVWSLVRGDKDEPLREALLAGELNLLVCGECGALFYPETVVIYMDPEAELLVFSFPESYQPEAERWRAKMHEDHAQMRQVLGQEAMPGATPILLFGLEPLRRMLLKDDELSDEVRVAEHLSMALGLKVLPVQRAWAREHGVPWILPCQPGKSPPTVASALAGLQRLLKSNDRLQGFRAWLKVLEASPKLPPLRKR